MFSFCLFQDDRSALEALLANHLVRGVKLSPSLAFATLRSVGGAELRVRARRGRVLVSSKSKGEGGGGGGSRATLVDGDLLATNGVVQVIDRVLL